MLSFSYEASVAEGEITCLAWQKVTARSRGQTKQNKTNNSSCTSQHQIKKINKIILNDQLYKNVTYQTIKGIAGIPEPITPFLISSISNIMNLLLVRGHNIL